MGDDAVGQARARRPDQGDAARRAGSGGGHDVSMPGGAATVTGGRTTWTTSLYPKDGRYIVPLKTAVRKG